MNSIIDLSQERAKRFFLNMLEKDGSKTMWDFSQSLKAELIKDPHNVFMAMDILWDCHDVVPSWFCKIWREHSFIESFLSKDISTYSGLMRGIKEEVEGVISAELYTYASPEYCRNEIKGSCWICKRRKNYKDCEGNNLPELLSSEELFKRWESISLANYDELGIRIGSNEYNDTIIECVYCDTKWNEDRDDFCMVTVDGNPLSPEYQEKFKRIKEGIENKEAEWYICPLNCHYIKTVIRSDS
ncbi:MAG: hypothetical protein R6V14_08060 [Halanaerobiales bacterium]